MVNDNRPLYLRLGRSWDKSEPLLEYNYAIIPRIGEAIELLQGVEDAYLVRVLDIKHSIIGDATMTEALVYPE